MSEKDDLLAAFRARVARGKTETKINNAALYAGSPMHYDCDACGCQDITVGEGWTSKPNLCVECEKLKRLDLLNEALGRPQVTGEYADLIRSLTALGVVNEKWTPSALSYFSHTNGRVSLSAVEEFFEKAILLSRKAAAALKELTGHPPNAS